MGLSDKRQEPPPASAKRARTVRFVDEPETTPSAERRPPVLRVARLGRTSVPHGLTLKPDEEASVQLTEEQDLLAYEVPTGYMCDPAREPEGRLWSMIGPSSFEDLDQAHNITKLMVP